MEFQDKVVVITGASSGIGAATAIEFSKEGAQVIMVGRNEAKLKKVADSCQKLGKKPLIIKADVSKDDDVKLIVSKTIAEYSKIDILINNAGLIVEGSLLEGNIIESYDEIMRTNVRGLIYLTMLTAPYLIKTKGNIVNISSVAALRPPLIPKLISYSISKAALDQFTKGAAAELAPHGVRVNSVNPGPVKTDILINGGINEELCSFDMLKNITALLRVSEPVEIADLVMYLASEKAKGITGSAYLTDNGVLLK